MSVLINMEMPKSCDDCRFAVDGWCYACPPESEAERQRITTNRCPLVPVPPHGRLIDADALYRKMFVGPDGQIFPNNDVDNWPHTMAFKDIKHHILFAPTIIPAEEGE